MMERSYLCYGLALAVLVGAAPLAAWAQASPATPAPAGIADEEVIVTGIRGSQRQAIDIKKAAVNSVDAIASEDLGKMPDQNVAESLQRVPGVTIDRVRGIGNGVTVRGLGPQFNTVTLNGRVLATDRPGREFNFDVLPPGAHCRRGRIQKPTSQPERVQYRRHDQYPHSAAARAEDWTSGRRRAAGQY